MATEKMRVLYALPGGEDFGGMCSITRMFYAAGVFESSNVMHFDTAFTWGEPKGLRLFQSIWLKLTFAWVLLTRRIDVVFVMTSSNWGFYDKCLYCLIARLLGVKSVLNPVGGYFKQFYQSSAFSRRVVPSLLNIPNAVVAGTSYWYGYFCTEFQIASLVDIPNPVSMAGRDGTRTPSAGGLTVLFLARQDKEKGVWEFVEAIETLLPLLPTLRIVIAGGGPLLNEVKVRLAPHCTAGRVSVLGFVDEDHKHRLFETADVYVLPTHYEVLPISVLEAMSHRVAVIAANVGGIPDAIEPDVTGVLVQPHSVMPIVNAVIRFNEDRPWMDQLAWAGYERCRRTYSLDAVLGEHTALFRRLTQ